MAKTGHPAHRAALKSDREKFPPRPSPLKSRPYPEFFSEGGGKKHVYTIL